MPLWIKQSARSIGLGFIFEVMRANCAGLAIINLHFICGMQGKTESRGEVLSRTRIYEGVWDERYDGLSNTLEVHVMELRKKLEARGDRLIHTLRNRGYRFGAEPGGQP